MKKMLAIAAILVVAAVVIAACGSDSGGGGTAVYTNATQAKTSTAAALNAVDSGTTGGLTAGLSGLSNTATAGTPYAKRLAHVAAMKARGAANADAIQSKMSAQLKSIVSAPAINKAVAKAVSTKQATISNVTYSCNGGGNISVSGTSNSDDPNRTQDIYDVTLTFNTCKELGTTTTSTDWHVYTGAIRDTLTSTISTTATTQVHNFSTTLTNLALVAHTGSFAGAVADEWLVNASFKHNYAYANNSTSTKNDETMGGDITANGTFVWSMVFNGTKYSLTETFTNLTDKWTGSSVSDKATGAGTDTWNDKLDGSIAIKGDYQAVSYGWNLSFTSLIAKWVDTFVASATAGVGQWSKSEEWINGSLSWSEIPKVNDNCASGAVIFTTADATPLTWSVSSPSVSWCPDSGEIRVNAAKITFKGSGTGTIDYGLGKTDFVNCELSTLKAACSAVM